MSHLLGKYFSHEGIQSDGKNNINGLQNIQ